MIQPQPVFVVGVPRSGTTLFAAQLTAHSQFAGGPETQLFSYWRAANQRKILHDPRWPTRAVAFLQSLSTVHRPVHEAYGVSVGELHTFLVARPPNADALLAALTEPLARRAGKPRWVEKSPNHLVDVREIRQIFPFAPILRLVARSADVALSLQAVPWGAPSLLANAYRWWSMDRASTQFFDTDQRSLTVFYEQLVTNPENELRRVCGFLGVEFEPSMLDTRKSVGAISLTGEWYKEKAGTPPDASSLWLGNASSREKDSGRGGDDLPRTTRRLRLRSRPPRPRRRIACTRSTRQQWRPTKACCDAQPRAGRGFCHFATRASASGEILRPGPIPSCFSAIPSSAARRSSVGEI